MTIFSKRIECSKEGRLSKGLQNLNNFSRLQTFKVKEAN